MAKSDPVECNTKAWCLCPTPPNPCVEALTPQYDGIWGRGGGFGKPLQSGKSMAKQIMNEWMFRKGLGWEFRDLASGDGYLELWTIPLVLSGPLFSMFVGINSPIK